jgi:chorismate mutase
LLEVLAKRFRVSREIGTYKKEHNMPVLQATRYDEILKDRISQAESMDINGNFMKTVLEAIHEESVRVQLELINKK